MAEIEAWMVALAIIVVAIGIWFFVSALANWDWYKGMVDFAAVEVLFGENSARWLCGLFGLATIGIGVTCFLHR